MATSRRSEAAKAVGDGAPARPTRDPSHPALIRDLDAIWRDLLPARSIRPGDDFFALGGDSMLAADLVATIQQRFGVSIAIESLLPEVTLDRLAREVATLMTARPAEAGGKSPLVPIQPHGSGPPFFCVHPSGGSVLCYLDLARGLGVGQPFYGIRGPSPAGDREPPERIEEIAAGYLEAVRAQLPAGPYLLGGYSFGGYVALEMARRLTDEGAAPALVALMDSRAPTADGAAPPVGGPVGDVAAVLERHDLDLESPEAELALWHDLLELVESHLDRVEGTDRTEPGAAHPERRRGRRMGAIQQFFRETRLAPTGELLGYHEVLRYMRLLRANFRSARRYRPRRYCGDVTLFLATERLSESEAELESNRARWRRLIAGRLDVHPVACHHLDLIAPPAVDEVAAALAERIESALAQPASRRSR